MSLTLCNHAATIRQRYGRQAEYRGARMSDSGELTNSQSRRIQNHPLLGVAPEVQKIQVTVDGQPFTACDGEPIAAALMANGIDICRAMPESGESRGVFCGVGRCSDCLMTVDGVLNVRTCVTAVTEGMRIETQHGLGHWEDGQP